MYRSDKQFMKNPATAPMRIYVGNLADSVQPANLDEKFSNHGRILGLTVQRGFGFVQFETEQQAQNAIKHEHGMMFYGRKLNVKQAIDNAKSRSQLMGKPLGGGNSGGGGGPPFNQQQNQQNQNQGPSPQQQQQQKPPVAAAAKTEEPETPEQESPQKTPAPQPTPPKPANSSPNNNGPSPQQSSPQQPNNKQQNNNTGPPPPQQQQQQNQPPPQKSQPPPLKNQPSPLKNDNNMPQKTAPIFNKDDGGPPEKKKRGRQGRDSRPMKRDFRDDYRDDYREEMPPYYEPPVPPAYGAPNYHPPMDRPERNDCEIIVVSKPLTEYAEYIEQRLKTLGLIVDLLFPNEDVPIGRVLANISSRGCLFSILVMPQNEEHRSLTLNILHGIPEEHRNMPIEDAFVLILRNFEAYMRGEKFGDKSESSKMSLTMRHPEHVQVVLNLLAENRQLNSSQYTKIIDYLQKKQELQTEFEVAEGIDGGVEPEVKGKQAELQSRIMNILNKKGDEIPEKEQKAPAPLLNDPTVQKALDSLLSGDMFKGLTS